MPSASSFRPTAPTWARGLTRSAYERFRMQAGQSPLFGPGFQGDVPVEDPDEIRRRQEAAMAGVAPAWTGVVWRLTAARRSFTRPQLSRTAST